MENQDELEEFLDELERGHDIGIEEEPSNTGPIFNPPMDKKSKIKMAKTILKWHKKDYLLGPFDKNDPIAKKCRINPVFSVPKPGDEVRPVINYSKNIDGHSLNDKLIDSWCTVEYLKIQEIVYTIKSVGKGAVMWAKDLEDGYFNIKVNPNHCRFMAFIFMGLLFIPMILAFGLSSAPLIFTVFMWFVVSAIRLADPSLTFLKVQRRSLNLSYFQREKDIVYSKRFAWIPLILFYLDDIFGINKSKLIYRQYELAGRILKFLGLSAKVSKDRPPSTIQIMLGLEYDSIAQEVRTPRAKGLRYIAFGNKLLKKKSITKKQLFSLTGKIRHASGQCRPLNAFARGVEAHGHKIKHWDYHVNMSRRLRMDINLMLEGLHFSLDYGVPFDTILNHRKGHFDIEAFTDAAGPQYGMGGYVKIQQAPYFQVRWEELRHNPASEDIQWREMAALFVLLDVMKEEWKDKSVRLWCDNEPVVWMLLKWRASLWRPKLQAIIREIAKICIFKRINIWWEIIKGNRNITADRLSRFKHNPFKFNSVQEGRDLSNKARDSLNFACRFCGI